MFVVCQYPTVCLLDMKFGIDFNVSVPHPGVGSPVQTVEQMFWFCPDSLPQQECGHL